MSKPTATIKTIIPPSVPSFAAFMPDKESDIDLKIVPIICWSLISFADEGQPDEVIGQIIAGDAVLEVTYVDEDEGFGEFLGYFYSEGAARVRILAAVAEADDEDSEGGSEGEEGEDLDEEEEEEEVDDEEEEDDEEEDEDEE